MLGKPEIRIGHRLVGARHPVFVIAEIGINHNGSLDLAKRMIDAAVVAGCDAVKFQKRTPERCVPRDQWTVQRDTPWGRMTYLEYRYRVEFDAAAFEQIDRYCRDRNILWFASCWDEESVALIERFDPPCYKAASASLTDHNLLRAMYETGKPLMVSTGMSTMAEIDAAVASLPTTSQLLIAHSTSTYPCPPEELNLLMLETLRARWPECPVGYSGHEAGITTTLAAVALGATFVERHSTSDRSLWGSDQKASLEPDELLQLVRGIRHVEASLGDGIKRVHESELAQRQKLRRVPSQPASVTRLKEPALLVKKEPGTDRASNGAA